MSLWFCSVMKKPGAMAFDADAGLREVCGQPLREIADAALAPL